MLCPCLDCRRHIDERDERCPFCKSQRGVHRVRGMAMSHGTLSRAAQSLLSVLLAGSACSPSVASEAGAPRVSNPESEEASLPPAAAATAPPATGSVTPTEPGPEESSPPMRVAIYGSPCVFVLERVEFGTHSRRISEEGVATLALIRELFTEYPELILEIRGHADAREQQARALARQRAESVRAWLLERGVAERSIPLLSCADAVPIVERGGAPNRRVDFFVRSGIAAPGEECTRPTPAECQ